MRFCYAILPCYNTSPTRTRCLTPASLERSNVAASPRSASARRAQHFTEQIFTGYVLLYTRTIEKPPPSNFRMINFRMNPTHSACTIVSITRNDSTKNSHQTVYFQLKGSYFFSSNFKYQWTLSTLFFFPYTRGNFLCAIHY